jgi:hypothetical protein
MFWTHFIQALFVGTLVYGLAQPERGLLKGFDAAPQADKEACYVVADAAYDGALRKSSDPSNALSGVGPYIDAYDKCMTDKGHRK